MENSTFKASEVIMTIREVMDFLKVSRTTIQRMCNRGELIKYRLSGRVYFKKSEIITAVEAGKEEPSLTFIQEHQCA